jgi:hypothetical protein
MRASKSSPLQAKDIRAIALEFHQRAFGEEMARVNFLTVAERKKYLYRLRQRTGRAAANRK